ncbi:hypothetical protein CFC21_112204 [Triticum aestivum]|uniref:F-box domain-containing protein n=3 Tax=Triticinae TaxID=1648030 RepID=A0A453JDQ5_AEGTS|nr:F-box/FBD/LRR-repeat protein At1g13570 [Aegilops tauschii subsp. strangulata]XP_020163613.1 F-box/FBD/LRR-repeat protein At1g13570 [Aegilops tauschii subsp. strangulata]XP_020163614.1 F-box/FBD/LRR-repeat protein At1g13570 [Aegilops tauschii subsp. strangulata]XP_020163615.1 F-box/FBD/LRR-repeat protein At1g13570 [Aegilops tauschii subsp. strangulata]XP_040243685.1 F-box/FBD/LRR-repeat protein At1g13570 [Aegilops tauschii subsp. strangulata]XP_040243686.1 F-box/FBD/LRR-repeat protein At1g13
MANIDIGSDEDLHQTMMMKPKRKGLQLTNLPKDILCSILSRLPIKEAVRTSILLEHWKHLWRCHSNLEFSLRSMFPGPRTNGPNDVRPWKDVFIERVDAVLQQHSGAGVDNIQFQAPCDDEHGDRIEGWVRFATASKTKQLILDFSATHHIEQHPYKIDLRLLDDSKSSHLQSIKLCSVSLKVPADFKGFRNLKWIFLADTNITDGDLHHLVSNCSGILEFLGIAGCGMLRRLHISHLSNKLKHLQVYDCRLLQAMELNFGLVKLEYRGPSVLLSPPGSLLLADICIKLEGICTNSLEYMFTKLGHNVPRLEILTLRCREGKMATLRGKLHEFVHLKHLRLDLTFGCATRTTDILEFACLLVAAPFLEKLEFHMWLRCQHERYSVGKGHLRSLPSQPHSQLRSVDITGFYGEKDQLELALHILRDSVVLESMKIDPGPAAAPAGLTRLARTEAPHFVDGYEVAREFLLSRDRRDVVHVAEPLACRLRPLMLGARWRIDAAQRASFFAALRRRNAENAG